MKKLFCCVFFLVAFSCYSQESLEEFHVGVTSVSVWIKATDSAGKDVTGLKMEDFEIYEDGKKVTVTCFEERRSIAPSTPATGGKDSTPVKKDSPQSRGLSRKAIAFLDLYSTSQMEYNRLRPNLQQFLKELTARKWEIMIVALLPDGKMGIVCPFTNDSLRIEFILGQQQANATRDETERNTERDLKQLLLSNRIISEYPKKEVEEAEDDRRRSIDFDAAQLEVVIRHAYALAQSYAKLQKQQAQFSLDAFESFAQYIPWKLEEGEHSIVVFASGGFNSNPGRRYLEMVDRILEKVSSAANPTEHAILQPGSVPETHFDLQQEVQKSIGKLNRSNMTVYSISTRGPFLYSDMGMENPELFPPPNLGHVQDYQDSLIEIAEQTGGMAFHNSQEFGNAFDSIMKDIGHQYFLCYSPPEHIVRDQYHTIRVVTKRQDVKLRHRAGYVD